MDVVYKTIQEHNEYLRQQLESYKQYLQNVRNSSGPSHGKAQKGQVQGPFKFSHAHMEREGIIVETKIPENRRANVYFNMVSPAAGSYVIALHYKGL